MGLEQEVMEFDPSSEVSILASSDFFFFKKKTLWIFEVGLGFYDEVVQVRALIEGQLLSMRAHAERSGMPTPPNKIIATGGASANSSILSSVASIFGCNVYTVQRLGLWTIQVAQNDSFWMLNLLETIYFWT